MFDKIQWKQEWRLSPRKEKNYYGRTLHTDMVVELTDDNKKIDVVLFEKNWILKLMEENFMALQIFLYL